jgi:8-oxo-dGTP pyrophosphatase MutT (NUDIX family)
VTAILYRREGAWHMPFVARRADLAIHPGQVGLPGGGVKEGESAWAAAAREVEEEIGAPGAELVALGSGPLIYAGVSNFSVVPFVAWLPTDEVRFVAQSSELDAVLEVPLTHLLNPDAWTDGGARPGRHLSFGEALIWGLTARILAGVLAPVETALRGQAS